MLRSKSPDLVLQEIWGHLCCHYAIRSLMAEAASHSGHDPDRVSFVAALRITRQTLAQPGAFLPLTSTAAKAPDGSTSSADSSGGSTHHAVTARRPASSNASTSSGTSNARASATWPQPLGPPSYTALPAN